jgi:YVTN family beta-propeller protein
MLVAAAAICLTAATAVPAAPAATSAPFQRIGTIALPGTGGHGDWVAYDPGADRIYVALHGSGMAVIDPAANRVVATVEPIKGPNGIAYDREYVYVAAGDSNELVVVSKRTWTIVGRVHTKGTSPDGLWVNRARGTVIVASDDANTLEVYAAGAAPRLLSTTALQPAHPKSGPDVGVLVASKGVLYMPDDALVEAVRLDTMTIGRTADMHIPLTKQGGTKGMVYDARTNHLWVGTTHKEVLVLNATTLDVVATIPAKAGIDEMAFDPGARFVYAFEGAAKGFEAFGADSLKPIAYVDTGSGNTHTGTVDPRTHAVYAYEGDANVVGVYAPTEAVLAHTGGR